MDHLDNLVLISLIFYSNLMSKLVCTNEVANLEVFRKFELKENQTGLLPIFDVYCLFLILYSRLWEEAGLELDADLCTRLAKDTTHDEEVIRQAVSVALAHALAENPDYLPAVLQQLIDVYEEKLYVSLLKRQM